jgi:Rv2632c-like
LLGTAAHPFMRKVITMQSTAWHVIIEFDEDDRHTNATATARVRENRPMTARGDAYRNPSDSNQPLVGEEIAAARALIDLGTQLLQAAAAQIEQVTNQPAHLAR